MRKKRERKVRVLKKGYSRLVTNPVSKSNYQSLTCVQHRAVQGFARYIFLGGGRGKNLWTTLTYVDFNTAFRIIPRLKIIVSHNQLYVIIRLYFSSTFSPLKPFVY